MTHGADFWSAAGRRAPRMLEAYAAALAVCVAALAIGQAAISLCGQRQWSWLSPAVGLALLCAICWGTVRLPGDGAASAAVVAILCVASLLFLRGRVEGGRTALWVGLPVALLALAAASLPFIAGGHFGILGTGFNPDMSQHLLATDRLSHGASSPLLHQGYPLGPHAIVVALDKGLGTGLVHGFDGLTIAVAILAPLTALAAFADRPAPSRSAAALVTGLAYMVASYYAQGAFKEVMQALFLLGFVLALREISASPSWRDLPLRFAPAALIAVGSAYVYGAPGLIWLLAALAAWLLLERALPVGPLALALLAFAVLVVPEVGRMIEFHNFETFDPNGPGLGNLFGQVSPFEALGIWPSGDFRVPPGGGAVPPLGYYLGAAFASILLVYGLVLCWLRRETALVAGLLAVVGVYALARLAGTPYTAAKSIVIAAPIVALVILVPLLRRPVAVLYLLAAGGCSLLAFANAPVGPTSYSPQLTGLRPLLASGPTLMLAPKRLLEEEEGERYIVWELRGGRVCVKPEGEAGAAPPPGVRFVVVEGNAAKPPYPGLRLRREASPYALWEDPHPAPGHNPCPLIAVRQARQGPAG
jgi:hypothetical protein